MSMLHVREGTEERTPCATRRSLGVSLLPSAASEAASSPPPPSVATGGMALVTPRALSRSTACCQVNVVREW